ncbi:sulfatase-like hydrolase/transferase [Pseudomonas sp. SK3(2021)]|uniref:sulfatase-like hydrolase/transferase n=1 Tax=Pseudomonas sp. SK3(2021) TaxID=2841064 RepID=UPI00192BE62A|nr:sulfatase-like hydrolase/transferase [Pseudomonas sp. SK3(2021)]QQZ42186.1 sulfatase-like hydrolase/transferase [Pseudomonas sp. SK3(2021)]
MFGMLKRLALPFLAASTIFLWVPVYALYLSRADINFSISGFFVFSIIITGVAGLVFLIFSLVLESLRFRWLASGILYFIVFWVSLAGFLLPLAGRAGMQSPEELPANVLNLILVGIISLVLTLLVCTKLSSAVKVFLSVLLVSSVGPAAFKLYNFGSTMARFSELSATDNVVVLSFDGIPGVVAKQVLEDNPQLKAALKDFVFYDNTVSLAPATTASLRSELYGNIDFRQLADLTVDLDQKLSNKANSIAREQNASSNVMTYGAYSYFNDVPSDTIVPGTLVESSNEEKAGTALNFYPHIAARIGTPVLAGWVGKGLRDIQERYLKYPKAERLLSHKGSVWDAASTLQSDELVALTQVLHITNASRVVRFMHFLHTHFPVDFDEKCNYRSDSADWFNKNQNYDGLISETTCALQQAVDYVNRLKELDVYDKTLLVVKSDHGAPVSYFDSAPEGDKINGHKLWGYNRYRPMLMVKPRVSDNPELIYNNELVSLSDLAKTLCIQAPAGPACDEYSGINLLNPAAEDSDPQLYMDMVKGPESSFEYDTQMTVVVPRTKDFIKALESTGKIALKEPVYEALYQQRVRDLTEIRKALEKYRKAHNGAYPVSDGFDGLHTVWGRSANDWIRGLAPTYIHALPQDPLISKDGAPQYLYRSDGAYYKLIAHGSADSCQVAMKVAPKLVDPMRQCWAFGYWSSEAQNW